MSDTPTPNAMLADERREAAGLFCVSKLGDEDFANARIGNMLAAFYAGWDAALRAPTIAPTSRSSYESDCCRAAYDAGRDDAAPTITVTEERLVAALKAWDDKWRFRNDRPGARDLCMFAALQAALATPSLTKEKE